MPRHHRAAALQGITPFPAGYNKEGSLIIKEGALLSPKHAALVGPTGHAFYSFSEKGQAEKGGLGGGEKVMVGGSGHLKKNSKGHKSAREKMGVCLPGIKKMGVCLPGINQHRTHPGALIAVRQRYEPLPSYGAQKLFGRFHRGLYR